MNEPFHNLVITREFKASRDLIYQAWTNREHAAKWFSPNCNKFELLEFDPQVSGSFHTRYTFDDDEVFEETGQFLVLAEPHLIIMSQLWHETINPYAPTQIVVHLEELAPNRTRMTFHQARFESAENASGHREGWNESFDNLEAHLKT